MKAEWHTPITTLIAHKTTRELIDPVTKQATLEIATIAANKFFRLQVSIALPKKIPTAPNIPSIEAINPKYFNKFGYAVCISNLGLPAKIPYPLNPTIYDNDSDYIYSIMPTIENKIMAIIKYFLFLFCLISSF
jgi:hypothetical protein